MTFPPPSHSAQSSIASGTDRTSSSRAGRSQQPSWGSTVPTSNTRRGLTPLATNTFHASSIGGSPSRRPPQPHNLTSTTSGAPPLTSSFSAVLSSTARLPNRNNPSPSSNSASFQFPQHTGGQQQPGQAATSQSSRSLTPLSVSHLTSSTASTATGGGSGGGGGGASNARTSTFSPLLTGSAINSPTGYNSDKPLTNVSGSNSSQSSLSKISVAQVFLLLDSINEKEGKEKWETKATQIHKLVDSNGMDVFSKYFRRLLSGNAPQIFPGLSKVVDNSGNYSLLVQEMQKVSQDPEQAHKIADTLDMSEGDIFRDFDLSTFLGHFRLDPISKVALALALKNAAKPDLRSKADAILTNSTPHFLQSISVISDTNKDFTPAFLASILERFILNPPRNFTDDLKRKLVYAARLRYQSISDDIPMEIEQALKMFSLADPRLSLVRLIQSRGPRSLQTPELIIEAIISAGPDGWSEAQIAATFLYMIISPNWQSYSAQFFLSTVQSRAPESFNWALFPRGFDRPGVRIDVDQFTRMFNILLNIHRDVPSLDVQMLWGGVWDNRDAQFSFLVAFLSSNIDISSIPNFRSTFSVDIFSDASEIVQRQAEQAQNSPLRSFDAAKAIFDLVLVSPNTWALPESQHFVRDILSPNLPIFVCSAFAIPQPWMPVQLNFVMRTFNIFISKQDGYQFALHGVWKLDREWAADALFRTFTQDPSSSELIYEHAVEHGWLDYILDFTNGLAMDLASIAHHRDSFDLESYIKNVAQKSSIDMGGLISKFLKIKAEDELRVQRNEPTARHMVPLSVKTVYTLLLILEDYIADHENLTPIQRICLQTYPRSINYGQGFDDIIEANSVHGNALPEEVERQMQELFGKMYHEELSLRRIVELMRCYKTSRDPVEQDMFTCMVHGLIDEYNCYPEYPLEALRKAAVLFGGIINFKLISGIPLKVGLGLILDSVREHSPDDPMYKFGVEAIEQLIARLPEWAGFCGLLLQIPSLRNTAIYRKAEEVLYEQGHRPIHGPDGEFKGLLDNAAMTNGNVDDLVAAETAPKAFRSIHVDPPLRPDIYRKPNEEVHDKILFILNNVSEQNIDEKLKDLTDVLLEEHHQWFASYLVEERAKLQPNFQQLYLDLLSLIGSKILWAEVLRETYSSASRLLNSEVTLNSTIERGHLKNLGCWLGSLTIARDKPIKHKNIYFKDLLVEAFDTQRLTVVIPFTCKVLAQARKSTVFKPPNPWLMDIISLLMEIYHFAELKTFLVFEIEVLCNELDLDHKNIEPSTCIRKRPAQLEDEIANAPIPEGLEMFDDMSLVGMNPARSDKLSQETLISSIPNLEQVLVLPPSASTMVDPNALRQIFHAAVERAIAEIISPVVERSIKIASISTADLVTKDFGMEPDEKKLRLAAGSMVRALAGILALVTCKEPLKISMTNYIKMIQQEYDQPIPEGLILMCVNDNLDAVCGIVERAAEDKSVPEVEKLLEPSFIARRRHRSSHPNDPFVDPALRTLGIDPFRHLTGGLAQEHLAIYENFSLQSRSNSLNHTQNISTDSGKQISDALQDPFPSIPNMPVSADPAIVSHQITQPLDSNMQHPAILTNPAQINGFLDANPHDKVDQFVYQLQQEAQNAGVQHIKDLERDSPVIQEYHHILRTILTSPSGEDLARLVAGKICNTLYTLNEKSLAVEVLVHLLSRICDLSPFVARNIWCILAKSEERCFSIPVTVALIEVGILDFHRIDLNLAKLIQARNPEGLRMLSGLLDCILLGDEPSALRSDFAGSLEAMNQWYAEDQNLPLAGEIIKKLRESGIPEIVSSLLSDEARAKRDQMEYIFSEWVGLYKFTGPNDRAYNIFLMDMYQRQVMNNQEDSALFFRLSVDISVAMFERESQNVNGSLDEAFLNVDALAKLVIMLVKFQGRSDGPMKADKASYLNSILSILILVLNHHQIMRGENFNQRVFFRLFSTILCEYSMAGLSQSEQNKEMMFVFAEKFLSLQPKYEPAFVFGWLALISHRIFLAGLLTMPGEAGWGPYCEIIQAMLSYMGNQLKPANVSFVAKDLYKGVLRILLILHHDFPEFVAGNHFQFCNVIPAHCTQLRNLVLSAFPSSFQKLPDPFREGLKVERLEEIRKPPNVVQDVAAPLEKAHLKGVVDSALRSIGNDSAIRQISHAIMNPAAKETGLYYVPINVDVVLLNALVLYVGQSAVSIASQKNVPTAFDGTSPSVLLEKLSKALNPEARYYFLSAIANQLRYPNSHTHFFSFMMLHLFGMEDAVQHGSDIREQIVRVLLERLIVHRPHPWGLIITLQELLQNDSYTFFNVPFIRQTPEIGRLFDALVQHTGNRTQGQ